LGLITSKFPQLEDKAALKERVFEAARIVANGTGETVDEALQCISVSPQCGFAARGRQLAHDGRHEEQVAAGEGTC
jgi:methionine synthase II (cobalamin-independent)